MLNFRTQSCTNQVLQSNNMTHVLSTSISRRFSVLVYIRCSRLPAVTAPNPNVAPLPALHEATLTASPTQKLQKLHSTWTTPPQLSHPPLKLGARQTPLRARGPTTNHSKRAPQYMKHCLTHVHTTVHLHPPFIYHTPSRPFFLPLLYAVETSSHTCSRTCCSCMVAHACPFSTRTTLCPALPPLLAHLRAAHVCPCPPRTTLCTCYISIVPHHPIVTPNSPIHTSSSIPTTIYPPYPLTLLLPIALLKDDVMHMLHLNPTTATEYIPQLSHPQLNPKQRLR